MRSKTIPAVILFILAGLFLRQLVSSQPVDRFSYQAVVRNGSGNLVANTMVGMKITLLQGTPAGTPVYVEKHNAATDADGLLSVEIGAGTAISGNMSTIDWFAGPYFVRTEMDITGGTNYTISGTSQLLSVPYALAAKEAGNGFSGDYNDLTGLPDLSNMVLISNPREGDMVYYTSGSWKRLPKGTEGDILTMSGGLPLWRSFGIMGIQGYFQFVTYKSGSSNPIAFGFIKADGTIASGSGNFTCIWNNDSKRYEIEIAGESYFWTNYTTMATLARQDGTQGASINVESSGGKLLIYIMILAFE